MTKSFHTRTIKIFTVLTLTLIGFLYSCRTTTEYVGGIQVNEFNQGMWANTLKASGMNTTQLTVYAKQEEWNSDHLYWNYHDTTYMIERIKILKKQDTKVVLVIRIALQHRFDENIHKWHGMIYPTTREQQVEWFYRYRYFLEMWAKICEREGVDVFVISSEMSSLTGTIQIDKFPQLIDYYSSREKQLLREMKIVDYLDQLKGHDIWDLGKLVGPDIRQFILDRTESNILWTQEAFHTDNPNAISIANAERQFLDSTWRDIIANTRTHYNGAITMAANHDSYQDISFWDDLDFIGINAYFKLRTVTRNPISNDSIYLEIVDGWEKVFEEIDEFKSTNKLKNKPIFFTEIGYTKKEHSTVNPWMSDGYILISNDNIDTLLVWEELQEKQEERVMAINALYQVVQKEKIPLIGINYWKLSSQYWKFTQNLTHNGKEPFMVVIGKNEQDKLQSALAQFLRSRQVFF